MVYQNLMKPTDDVYEIKKNIASLTIVQMNHTHAYFDVLQEMFWQGDDAVYYQAGGYARIATTAKNIRTESSGYCLFCDCGDTMHGPYPAIFNQYEG
jgi:S-sulfosulfanyl-L-cysteine sulfohydrolase